LFAGAEVQESAFLPNRLTGQRREVDVVIRGTVGGYPLTVSVEARSAMRRADAPWVESMIGKHQELPTDKLILVSRAGFTDQARELATRSGVIPVSPKDISADDFVGRIVNNLGSLWPKLISLTPSRYRVSVRTNTGGTTVFPSDGDHLIFTAEGHVVASIQEAVIHQINSKIVDLMEQIGMRDMTEDMDRKFSLTIGGPTMVGEDARLPLFARFDELDPPELHAILEIEAWGDAHIEVREATLTHSRLGDAFVAYGSFVLTGRSALVVVTESEDGGNMTMRLGETTMRSTIEGD
jgi:hypothetical protein